MPAAAPQFKVCLACPRHDWPVQAGARGQVVSSEASAYSHRSSPLSLALSQVLLSSPTKAAAETLDLDHGRVQCTVSTGAVKATAALTYNMTADTLPQLANVRLWPLEEAHHPASTADQDGSELLVSTVLCAALQAYYPSLHS